MTREGLAQGARQGMPICVSFFVFGIAFGVAAVGCNLSFPAAVTASTLIFSGSSQFLLLGSIGQAGALGAIALSMFLLNIRYVVMGVALMASVPHQPAWRRVIGLLLMIDETWAVAMSPDAHQDRLGAVTGCGIVAMAGWVAGTAAGAALGGINFDPNRFGINFVYYSVFLFILTSMWRWKDDILPWAVAVAVATVSQAVLPGKWHVIIGGVAGALAGGLQPWSKTTPT